MTGEEVIHEIVARRLYVMPPAAVGPREWYVTDDDRTAHGFGIGPVQAVKDFIKNKDAVPAPVAGDLSFLE